MSENKLCPHCGSKMFMATITRGCVVEVTTDSDNPYKVLKESKDKFNIEILKCVRCKHEIKEEDLVGAVQCKQCGRLVTPADVDENGVCDVCNAMKQRTELANASKEDLVKMLLEAEKRSNPIAAKMADKQMSSNGTDDTDAGMSGGFTLTPVDESAETTEEEKPVEKAPKTRARRRKTDDAPVAEPIEESQTEAEAIEEPVEETAVADLANQQEAPFPDMNLPEEMTDVAPVAETPAQTEQAIGADFRMFDEGGDAF